MDVLETGLPRRRKLLVVDDEQNVLVGMRRFFQANGFDVDVAQEREEAEALLDHATYDCLIADLCITEGRGPDGLSLVEQARAASPRTRIVVLTAAADAATRDETMRLGADVFLRKPAALADVLAAVRSLAGARS